jgi:hypothetical protein
MSKGDDQVWFALNLGKSGTARVRVELDSHIVWFVVDEQELKESMWLDKEPRLEISAELLAELNEAQAKFMAAQDKLRLLYRSQEGMPRQFCDDSEPPPHKVLK